MPAEKDHTFHEFLDSITNTSEEDTVRQIKCIKKAEFAKDSREPTADEEEVIKREVGES